VKRTFLARYVDAFERVDVDALVALLHDDVIVSMPPVTLWLQGHAAVRRLWAEVGDACRRSRLAPLVANGSPAFAQWKLSGPGGRYEPWAIQVLDVMGDAISGVTFFVNRNLFPLFDASRRDEARRPGPRLVST
jgi:RNA polymerase sigma-70 factor (ECF subfamily)